MSYTPTEWKTGDVITADKLNNIEDGIVNAVELFVITATNVADVENPKTQPMLDKTFLEITEAIEAGKLVVLKMILQTGTNIFLTNASIDYNNGEISTVEFNYETNEMTGDDRWEVTNTVLFISSRMAQSAFSIASFTIAT